MSPGDATLSSLLLALLLRDQVPFCSFTFWIKILLDEKPFLLLKDICVGNFQNQNIPGDCESTSSAEADAQREETDGAGWRDQNVFFCVSILPFAQLLRKYTYKCQDMKAHQVSNVCICETAKPIIDNANSACLDAGDLKSPRSILYLFLCFLSQLCKVDVRLLGLPDETPRIG